MKLRNISQLTAQGFALCLLLALATVGLAQSSSLQPANQQAASQAEETKGKKKKSGKKSAKKSDEAETAAPAMPASGSTGTTAAATPDATAQEAPAPTGKKQKGGAGSGKKAKGGANANASAAIRAVLDAQVAAWNAGNLEDFMRGYWNSPELTFVSGGRKVMGYNATIERYRRTYQAEGKEMGKLTFSDLEITQLGNDAAFVRGVFQLIMSDARELGGRYTLILRLFPDGWKIVHDHTSSN